MRFSKIQTKILDEDVDIKVDPDCVHFILSCSIFGEQVSGSQNNPPYKIAI